MKPHRVLLATCLTLFASGGFKAFMRGWTSLWNPLPATNRSPPKRVFGSKATWFSPTLVMNEERDGPIIPDALMALYICARPRDREASWPIGILGFHRDLAGRHWREMSLVGRYAGRKGPPTA